MAAVVVSHHQHRDRKNHPSPSFDLAHLPTVGTWAPWPVPLGVGKDLPSQIQTLEYSPTNSRPTNNNILYRSGSRAEALEIMTPSRIEPRGDPTHRLAIEDFFNRLSD
jgi:hypothetical protein